MRLLLLPLALSACIRHSPKGDDDTAVLETGNPDSGDTDTAVDTAPDTAGDSADDTSGDTAVDTAPVDDADGDLFTVAQGDCDDADPTRHPGADEVCDGIDQDCDGQVDEGVLGTFYADVDGDGHGDPAAATESCEGAVSDDDDCDDTRADVYPGATEACDDVDNDCDGAVDEDGLTMWFADNDGDGYGDVDTGVLDCAPTGGSVANWDDCDDTDATVSPLGTEVCNGVDDDCDGTTDEGLGSTWYIDYDADGYGSSAYVRTACTQPSGYVATNDDCDDVVYAVNPGATEVCNAVDDDCDGTVDEDDAADASTWYLDADADTWGDSAVSTVSCEAPTGYVAPDGDCDDADPIVYPGAPERFDGLDNDCDGTVDDNTWIGTGTDGPLVVTGTTDLSTDASGGRAFPDGVTYAVTGISGADVTLDATADGLAAGDEVLIVNLQGSSAAHTHVGAYEFAYVGSTSGSTVTLEAALAETFGETSNTDLSDQHVALVRVPQYTDVTIDSAGLLTSGAWDGATGGVLAFRATGLVSIAAGGAVAMDESGFAGGSTGTAYNNDAFQGESYAGEGCGDASGYGVYYNVSNGCYTNNFGGGGADVTGGGGEYAGGATAGASWDGGSANPPEAGDTYGDVDLSHLFFGSGGGGVWYGASNPGPGGDGGGVVFIGASAVTADGAAAITSLGGTTPYWATGSWTYGAGGGAGGSVWVIADTLTLVADAIDAEGGLGESTHIRVGGDGGVGRVRVDCNAVNGVTCGTASATTELDAGSEPDVGYSVVP